MNSNIKELLLGNAAVARGLYEAGISVVSAYPGTPSTEITEAIAKYDEVYSEWAPNEKVAFEVAFGAALGGARAFCAMKHVGLNVAADPLYTASYIGTNGGMVCAVADDPGMHSSQNEQDSRHHAIASKVPMLEPASSQECKDYAMLAFELSEKYDTPVLLRLSTRISHSRSPVTIGNRNDVPLRGYKKDPQKHVMMPAMARARHLFVEERTEKLREYAETSGINKTEYNSDAIGIICAGTTYNYAKEAMGKNASYLKLGMVNPLPVKLIKDFASKVKRLVVIEELDDIIETHCLKNGIPCEGKNLFPLCYDFSANLIREKLFGIPAPKADTELPGRPPVMCAGCPHRGVFYLLAKNKITVTGDIGCYSLGAMAPLSAMDAVICMGASVSMAHGFEKARGREQSKHTVAVIGDSTFVHTGVNGLINAVYNKSNITLIILDNSTTGMTGHQENPATGKTIRRESTHKLDLYDLCKACGADSVRVTNAYDLKNTEKVIKEELAREGVSVIIAQRPCALLDKSEKIPHVVSDKCRNCKACLKLGCPAIIAGKDRVSIDFSLCTGCGVCEQVCPFGAITAGEAK